MSKDNFDDEDEINTNDGEFILDDDEFNEKVIMDMTTGAVMPHSSTKRRIRISEEPFIPKQNIKNDDIIVNNDAKNNNSVEQTHTNPVKLLYNNSSKTKITISVDIEIDSVSKELYKIISNDFNGKDELINIMVESIHTDSFNENVKKSLEELYKNNG